MDAIILLIFVFLFSYIIIAGVAVVLYVWIKPFIPYIMAKLQKKDVIFLIGKDNKVRLVPAKYSSGIYTTVSPPYSFLHKVQRAYRFGDLQCVFVHDGWGVTLDPDYAEVIEELKLQGITDYEELERRLEDTYADGKQKPEEELLKHADIIKIHAFKDIDFGNFLAFVADMTPTEIRSHLDEYIAKFVEDQKQLNPDQGKGMNMTTVIIIVICAIIGYFALKSFGIM
jgi:hypothetical protein